MQTAPEVTTLPEIPDRQIKKSNDRMNLINRILYRLRLKPIRKSGYLIVHPLENEPDVKPSIPIEVQQVYPEDEDLIDELAAFSVNSAWYKPENTKEIISQLFQEGDLCFIARHNGAIICRVWINTGHPFQTYGKGTSIPLLKDQVYYYDAYTAPEYRGKSIYPYVKIVTSRLLRQQYQKKYAISYIEAKNTSSLNAQKKIGATRAHKAGSIYFLGRTFYYGWHNPMKE